MDILAKISEKKGENLTASELEEILKSTDYSTQGTLSNEENILERTLTSKDGKYEIPVSEIYNGNLKTSQSNIVTPKTISFTINDESYTTIEGQTWYEWAEATKNDESSYCNSSYWGRTWQEIIIDFYNEDNSSEVRWENGGDYWHIYEGSTTIHVNDVIVENNNYREEYYEEE